MSNDDIQGTNKSILNFHKDILRRIQIFLKEYFIRTGIWTDTDNSDKKADTKRTYTDIIRTVTDTSLKVSLKTSFLMFYFTMVLNGYFKYHLKVASGSHIGIISVAYRSYRLYFGHIGQIKSTYGISIGASSFILVLFKKRVPVSIYGCSAGP